MYYLRATTGVLCPVNNTNCICGISKVLFNCISTKYSTSNYVSLSQVQPILMNYADVGPHMQTAIKAPPPIDNHVQYSLLVHGQQNDPAGITTLDQYSDTTILASFIQWHKSWDGKSQMLMATISTI